MRNLYLLLAVGGLILPLYFLYQFLSAGGEVNWLTATVATPVARQLSVDLVIAGLTALIFMYRESQRLQMRRFWVYVAGTLGIGLCFGLPLFLYFRERRLAASD